MIPELLTKDARQRNSTKFLAMFYLKACSASDEYGNIMIMKLLMTIGLMVVSLPAVGVTVGLGIGTKGGKCVYPTVVFTWGIIIYVIWFT